MKGRVTRVVLRGREAFKDGKVLAEKGFGKNVERWKAERLNKNPLLSQRKEQAGNSLYLFFIFRLESHWRIYAIHSKARFDMECPDEWLAFADQGGPSLKCEY